MNAVHYYGLSAFFNGLVGFFLVYIVYLRNRKNPLNQSFLIFGISVSSWSLVYSFWAWSSDKDIAEFLVRSHMMSAAFIPVTFLHFSSVFVGCFEKYKKGIVGLYLVSAVYSILMRTDLMIAGVHQAMFFPYWPVSGFLLPSFVFIFALIVVSGLWLLLRECFCAIGSNKRKAIVVFLAFLIGFSGGSVNWLLWFDIAIPPTTNFFVGIMFAMVAYAMTRYGLMDADQMLEFMRTSRQASLGLWASSLSHALRNPLFIARSRIEAHLNALQEKRIPEDSVLQKNREVLESAAEQLKRAGDMIQQFSRFLKPGYCDSVMTPVSLKDILETVTAFISEEIALQRIKVIPDESCEVLIKGEKTQLEEIFFNLIMNACQAIKLGRQESGADISKEGEIRISAEEKAGKVKIAVADNGPGMDRDRVERIFEPFFTTKQEGTGLGLYITKQLVEKNGGKITVKSKAGAGTIFTIEFTPGETAKGSPKN